MSPKLRKFYDISKTSYNNDFVSNSSYEIMLNCWQEDPDGRPTFENLTVELKEMEKQHKVK